jgi:hypothetical protein
LGAPFLLERSYLRFRDFDLAHILLGASFHPERSYLRFRDFELDPSFWGFHFVCVVLWSQWFIVELDLPTSLSVLAFGLSNANLTLLDILTWV